MAFDWQTELATTVKSPSTAVPPAHLIQAPTTKSFAQALVSATVTENSAPLPSPIVRGETLSIQISQETYARGIEVCKRNLRGRLMLSKGDKPDGYREVLIKLQQLWTNIGPWKMTPLGKGYFEFAFASNDDMRSVWAKGTLNLKPGLLRLFEWTKDFSARTQRQTHAQVWIRLHELPQEYWMDRTLKEIASAVGTPLLVDSATQNRVFGHYARILVDMDLSQHIFNKVLIEREGYSFTIEITYERLPLFCTHCRSIGHHITNCRWLQPAKDAHVPDKQKNKIISQKLQAQKWQPKDNLDGIGSSRAFQAPEVNNEAADCTRSQADALPLQLQLEATARHDEQAVDVSVQVAALHTQAAVQLAKQPADLTCTFDNVEPAIRQETRPSTSVHVLEEINDAEDQVHPENACVESAALHQQPSFDVMTMEHSARVPTKQTETAGKARDEATEVSVIPVRDVSIQPQEIQVSQNVQSDLDLWARIREYDQQMAEEGFTQVLSKKQQQTMKKQALGKASYNTRAKGTHPPSQ